MSPDGYTIQETFIDVGDGHKLYVHEWGNRSATTSIIFLHGGPGSGVSDKHKHRFHPEKQHVIFFDQRGSGKSLPKGSLEHNTTPDLVEDVNKIADKLKLSAFTLVGGSWGSCLALAYSIKYPRRVAALILSGIFTARKEEIDYLDNGGFRLFYPDLWDAYAKTVPDKHKSNPSAYHYKNILSSEPDLAKHSAYAYSEYLEGPLLSLDDRYSPSNYDEFDPNAMRIELHYLHNRCFLPEGYILKNAHKLTMPVWLVQGRYDMICPPQTAYELHEKLPQSELIWTTAGHGNDRPNYDVLRTLYLRLVK